MKAYIIIDNDFNLHLRTKEFIDSEPGFLGQMRHCILEHWVVDSEDESSMSVFLSSIKKYELTSDKVSILCKQLGYDLQAFLERNRVKVPLFSYNQRESKSPFSKPESD